MELQFFVTDEADNQRLDLYLLSQLSEKVSRTSLQNWIREGAVQVGSRTITKTGYKIRRGEVIVLQIPKPQPVVWKPIPMDIEVLWEDEFYAIVHKPPGIATHPGMGDTSPSLAQGLAWKFSQLSEIGGAERPGIVHRLDKPTEGVLVVAKSNQAHFTLARLFQNREVQKIYYAWVLQAPPLEKGTIQLPIGRHPKERWKMAVRPEGRMGITHYEVQKVVNTKKGRKFSFLKIHLETGRTHQIRVHMQNQNCPVVGDILYSKSGWEWERKYGLLLLAKKISFQHPLKKIPVEAEIGFPERFLAFENHIIHE